MSKSTYFPKRHPPRRPSEQFLNRVVGQRGRIHPMHFSKRRQRPVGDQVGVAVKAYWEFVEAEGLRIRMLERIGV